MRAQPVTVVATYRVKPGRERKLRDLLAKHWRTLRQLGLGIEQRPLRLAGLRSHRRRYPPRVDARTVVEIFSWRSAYAAQLAHRRPEVLAIWEPMAACCSSMEFPHFVAR